MSTSAQEIEKEINQIRNNAFDIKGHFSLLFHQLVPEELLQDKQVVVINELFNETTLLNALQADYSNKEYVMLFYAHKPHSPLKSPTFPNEPHAHTSLLLCKVGTEARVDTEHILNIDGYDFPSYVDTTRNQHIKQRLVIRDNAGQTLQEPSWANMNCVLYAFSFGKKILQVFKDKKSLIDTAFFTKNYAGLHQEIQEGMVGKYVTASWHKNADMRMQYHTQIREELANSYRLEMNITAANLAPRSNQERDTLLGLFSKEYAEVSVKRGSALDAPRLYARQKKALRFALENLNALDAVLQKVGSTLTQDQRVSSFY